MTINRHAKIEETGDGYYLTVKKGFVASSKSDAIAIATDQGIPMDDIKIEEAKTNERD